MRITKHRLLLAICLCGASLRLAIGAGRTNEAAFSSPRLSITLDEEERSEILVDRFFEEVMASDSIVFDRFTGPASRLAWVRKQDTQGYASIGRFNAEGASMFARIGLDSLRTAALEVLPVDLWQDHWEAGIANLILGTLGHPEEEHLRLTSISYSDVRASWESANQNAGIQWGLRPWGISPYVYVLAHAGHFNRQPLITFEGRAAYTLFGPARLEGRVTLPLPGRFRIAGGASVDPARMRSHDIDASHVAVTLERVIRSHGSTPDSVFYIGFRSGVNRTQASARPENLLVVGLSRSW
jgi:hypothetical protein